MAEDFEPARNLHFTCENGDLSHINSLVVLPYLHGVAYRARPACLRDIARPHHDMAPSLKGKRSSYILSNSRRLIR